MNIGSFLIAFVVLSAKCFYCQRSSIRLVRLRSDTLEASLDTQIYWFSNISTSVHCALLCAESDACQSVFYSKLQGMCQLHNAILQTFTQPVFRKGIVYYTLKAENNGCHPSWKWEGDIYRHYSTDSSTWPEAAQRCDCMNGNLAKIESAQENKMVLDNFKDISGPDHSGLYGYWIGASSSNDDMDWKWEDGTEVRWTDWGWNEPDRDFQHYISVLFPVTGIFYQWGNHGESNLGFVCETTHIKN